MSAGAQHTCAVTVHGALYCFGLGEWGELGNGDTTGALIPVRVGTGRWSMASAGDYHTCGVQSDGSLWCWGAGWSGQLGLGNSGVFLDPQPVAAGRKFTVVSAARNHTCAVRDDGSLWCWGDNGFGQLGDGTRTERDTPVRVGSDSGWTDVASGPMVTCGLRARRLYCFGFGGVGEVGDGTLADASRPVAVLPGIDVAVISVGAAHACAITSAGALWCWGGNGRGTVGDGSTILRATPVQIEPQHHWIDVDAGLETTCAVRSDRSVWCWGARGFGALGDGTTDDTRSPRSLDVPGVWRRLVLGGYVAGVSTNGCGLRVDGSLWCWGSALTGAVPFATGAGSSDVPVQVGGAARWRDVTLGAWHGCGVRVDGSLWCWGHGRQGQLGTGTFADHLAPVRVGTESDWTTVAAGEAHTCGARADGTLWCWGDFGVRFESELAWRGYGLGTDHGPQVNASPTQVGADTDWSSIIASESSRECAGKRDGTLWCFNGEASTLARVDDSTTWQEVAGGDGHLCARRSDGSLWCWGSPLFGQIGNGSRSSGGGTPFQVVPAATWTDVAAGGEHSCGVQADGSVWCWGRNVFGQLGDGTRTERTTPVRVQGLTGPTSVVAGAGATCAVDASARLACWGDSAAGAIPDGTAWQPSPVRVALP